MKDLFKAAYYFFQKKNSLLKLNLHLAYIFHTEKIYDDQIFSRLLSFCIAYQDLTGAKPICAIIPPSNPLLRKEMEATGFSEADFCIRIAKLSQWATLGYHGHFYLDEKPLYHYAIHSYNFRYLDLEKQFLQDVRWFEENGISHNGIYAGGWWFFNKALLSLLLNNDFRYDFSFSQCKYFYNVFSMKLMNENNIRAGQSFYLKNKGYASLQCIQNLIALHQSKYPMDFNRNLLKLYPKGSYPTQSIGVVNAHDHDLHVENTLNCIQHLIKFNGVEFHTFENLVSLSRATGKLKTIECLDDSL